MKTINFSRVEIFTNVARTQCVVQDIREAFADLIYNQGSGIKSHALALKIYNSKGEEEYSPEEVELIKRCASLCTPALIDAIERITAD